MSTHKKNDDIPDQTPPPSVPSAEHPNHFGREQTFTTCPFCKNKIYTLIEQQTTWTGILFSIILLLFLGFYSFLLILLLIPLTQSTIHSCPNCLNTVGIRSFYDTLSLTDKVFTFQFLSLGIIITKKQILALFIFSFLSIIFYIQFYSFIPITKQLPDTWNDFIRNCANRETCIEKYLHKEIAWKGYVIRVNFIDDFFTRYKASVLLMVNEKGGGNDDGNVDADVDVVLHFDYFKYEKYKTEVLNTTRGDLVEFNATVINIKEDAKQQKVGKKNVVMVEVNSYRKGNEKVYIAPHVHLHGRYHVDKNMINNVYSELPGIEEHKEEKQKKEKE